jgi:DHA1 family tetracycline resistance protein-like MFS transporter
MNSRRALAFIFCTITLDMLAVGLMLPILPRLVLEFEGGDTVEAANVVGIFGTMWGLMQFISAPVLGALSDRYGRRPVILLSCLGLGLDYIFMAVAPSLTLLFVGRVISGITAATITTSAAFITDVTRPEERGRAFGLIGLGFSVAFVLGPAAGGLLGSIDLRLPFWCAAAAALANAAFGWFVLPESLPVERRMAFSWKRANPVGAFRMLARKSELLGLAATGFLGQLAHQIFSSVFVLYLGYRYDWGAREVGLTLALVGVCAGIVQGGLVGPVIARLGERRTLLLGLLFGPLGMAIYGLAPTGALFCLGVLVMAPWGLSGPAGQGLMTRLVDSSEQGQLQGANTSLASVAFLAGPGLFAVTFASFIGHRPDRPEFPGAAFLLAALILLLAFATAWWATRRSPAAPPR